MFFRSVREAESAVKRIRMKQEHYLDMATGMSGMSESNIRSTSTRSRVEMAAMGMVDLCDALGAEAEQYLALIRRAEEITARIVNHRYRQVLELRYLMGYSWERVAAEMGYKDVKSAFRVHGWALLEAQKILCGG